MEQTHCADKHLGIVCPVANEEATIEAFVKDVLRVCDGCSFGGLSLFLIIDPVSTDNTLDMVRELAAAWSRYDACGCQTIGR